MRGARKPCLAQHLKQRLQAASRSLWLCSALACAPSASSLSPPRAAAETTRPPENRAGEPEPDCPRAMSLEPGEVEREVVCLLQRYVRIDTVNPPGNELRAVAFLQAILEREGVEVEVIESAPGRGNLLARLASNTAGAGAVMWMHHMDVVPASASEWSTDPFAATIKDGYLYGRGSLDNKGGGIAELVAFLLLKRLKVPLRRDVVLLSVADEESGGEWGARWLVQHQKPWFEGVEFVLNEGGAILDLGNDQKLVSVEIAQKAPLWLRVTARGVSGHGSTPKPNSAAAVLVRALGRLSDYRFATVVIPEVAEVFRARAAMLPEARRAPLLNLETSLKDPAFRAEFEKSPGDAALVQNTLAITMLSGSPKENVIAEKAEAVLDVRLLPGQEVGKVIRELEQVMAEPSLEVTPMLSWTAHASSSHTPLFEAIRRFAGSAYPGAPVAASVIGGFTDCNALRAVNIVCYGFIPSEVKLVDLGGVHGKDERVSTRALAEGVANFHHLLAELDSVPR